MNDPCLFFAGVAVSLAGLLMMVVLPFGEKKHALIVLGCGIAFLAIDRYCQRRA